MESKKTIALLIGAVVATGAVATTTVDTWQTYDIGHIKFRDRASDTRGSQIYHNIITNPERYIAEQARVVLSTLYFSPSDSIAPVYTLRYSLEDSDGISAKSGGGGNVAIFYSTRHVENSFADADTLRMVNETRGVLLHELTHAYQLEPQGIGHYGDSRVFWSFIEGMADAVRAVNGGFSEADRIAGGNYDDGYRQTGFFFAWLKERKHPDMLRLLNRSTLEVVPWSYEGAIKYALGDNADIDELWEEYQAEICGNGRR